MNKILVTIGSALLLIMTNIMPAFAQTGQFTIYPSYMHGDNKSWIIRDIEQGKEVKEYVTIENLTNEPQEIAIDLREATEKNGTFLPVENREYRDLGLWTNLSQTDITLAPYEKQKVPLKISIPENANTDEYKATILASITEKNAQGISITTRIGVRMYINVKRAVPMQANVFNTKQYADSIFFLLSLIGMLGAIMYSLIHRNKLKHLLLAITIGLFSLNLTPVFAQQMLIQVVGGGYRFDGPTQITFTPVAASFTQTDSEVSIRTITSDGYTNPPVGGQDGFISINDQNGGSEFQVQVQSSGALTHTVNPAYTIPLTNFQVKNLTTQINDAYDVQTINGRTDGLTLNGTLNDYTNLTTARVLATGSGQQPGTWKFYPGFRIQVPATTAIGIYETTLTFTII